MNETLRLESLHAGYQGSKVLEDLSLEVHPGEVVCVLGANGAGKTTTLLTIAGLLRPMAGRITLGAEDLLRLPPYRIVERGISLVPEGRQVFPNLTVLENLLLGSYCARARKERASALEEVYTLFPRLRERLQQMAGLLSGGEQQMLAIGRALMSRPSLLLLDEPSLGLAPRLVQAIFDAIGAIAARGRLSILLVEQNARAALSLASRGYVLVHGQVAVAGSTRELQDSPRVKEAFLG
jgi:branched-chain amino acid transport system ATP-binding protein